MTRARSFVIACSTLLTLVCCAAPAAAQNQKQLEEARNRMVDEEIVAAGVKNPRVIDSVRKTPRHEFMPIPQRKNAYFDMALPIGEGQTISPPFVVSYMTEQLDPQPEDKVLEIGTGSGYQAAILSPLVKEVYSIEIVESLGKRAADTLKRLKYENVFTKVGDGYQGWAEHAPFDKIIVTCSPENVPQALVDQLKEGGRMIIPLGERYQQSLYLYRKEGGQLVAQPLLPTMFVPMTGAAEDSRQVLPDPLKPALVNGGFEEAGPDPNEPANWYYQRLNRLVMADDAPEGKHYLTFRNSEPGREARALQAFAIDGRKVREIDVSAWVKLAGVRRGRGPHDYPAVAITWYDENRKPLEKASGIGGRVWQGTFDWEQTTRRLQVPLDAREAILRVGLLGATGEASFDDVRIEVVEKVR
jgi:protein-L-isoaspartate(D-aspartate) O-methyltransferase